MTTTSGTRKLRISAKLMVSLASSISTGQNKVTMVAYVKEMCSTCWGSQFETVRYQQLIYKSKRRKIRSYSKRQSLSILNDLHSYQKATYLRFSFGETC
ncbi:unnamed protein product [Hymenolepis diminuta]|uniref:Uncharacterized protein n=1 Tax=Hymenolepis diminuta TaxID=6216 RepID=A0A564ZB22_HYMDI|nr:unnamed protein product [Hymenolepis diminuta]